MVRKSSFTASLRMPNDPRGYPLCDFLPYNHCSEKLLIAHNVLLVYLLDGSIFTFFCLVIICNAVF